MSLQPSFLIVMLFTPILVTVALYPVYSVLIARVASALHISQRTVWIREIWWDKWYSWLFIGGPPGRWVVGTILGVKELQMNEDIRYPGERVIYAGAGLLLSFGFALLLGAFALVWLYILLAKFADSKYATSPKVMASISIRNISLGRTTYESYLPKKRLSKSDGAHGNGEQYTQYICIPSSSNDGERIVVPVSPSERLYDLGFRRNWVDFLSMSSRREIDGRYVLMAYLLILSLKVICKFCDVAENKPSSTQAVSLDAT